MARHVVLLRGVNIGGVRVPMAELREALDDRGYGDVVTYVQSGNVIVTSRKRPASVASDVETLVADRFGYEIRALARSATELAAIRSACPFDPESPSRYVTFLAERPDPAAVKAIPQDVFPPDRWAPGDGVIYLDCVGGYGNTKIGNPFWERKLKVAATTRNWRTLGALIELGGGQP